MLAAAPWASDLGLLLFGLRSGRRAPVGGRLLGNHLRLDFWRCLLRSPDGELFITGLRAHVTRGLAEKEASASRPTRFRMNDQSDLKRTAEIASMNFLIALGEKDPATNVGMIPPQTLQTLQVSVRARGSHDLCQTLLVFIRKNKPRAHGMLAWESLAGKDTNAVGFLQTEQDAAGFPLAMPQIAVLLNFAADLFEHRRGTLHQERALRDPPNFEVPSRGGPPLFCVCFVHRLQLHIKSHLRL
jgi:hypothetical protein